MDTLPGVVEILPEEEEGKEGALSLMWDSLTDEMGSVVGVEIYSNYPHHCGSGHTPLLSPATIPEKGVELGCVIGLQTTGVQEHTTGVYIDWRFAR